VPWVRDQRENESEALLLTAMEDLARDVRPFEESPRTCDLFRIHDHIAETIARALTLLRSREAWERVAPLLQTIAHDTTIWVDRRHAGGPLTPTMLVALLLQHAQQIELQEWRTALIEEQTNQWQEMKGDCNPAVYCLKSFYRGGYRCLRTR